MASVPLKLEELPVEERRSAVTADKFVIDDVDCWSISPSPSVLYWEDEHIFTVCCCECGFVPIGEYYFYRTILDDDGEPTGEFETLVVRHLGGVNGDPCMSFSVRVPRGADHFCLEFSCVRWTTTNEGLGSPGVDPRSCRGWKCFPCERHPGNI